MHFVNSVRLDYLHYTERFATHNIVFAIFLCFSAIILKQRGDSCAGSSAGHPFPAQISDIVFSSQSQNVSVNEHPAVVIITVLAVSVPSCPIPVAMT